MALQRPNRQRVMRQTFKAKVSTFGNFLHTRRPTRHRFVVRHHDRSQGAFPYRTRRNCDFPKSAVLAAVTMDEVDATAKHVRQHLVTVADAQRGYATHKVRHQKLFKRALPWQALVDAARAP